MATSKLGLKPIYSTKDPYGNRASTGEEMASAIRYNNDVIDEAISGLDQKAGTAAGNSAAALSTAQEAKTTAQSASTKADTATSTANTAKATADNASSTASSALTTAQEAKTTAGSASTKADTATSTANTAKATADNASSTASSALTTAQEAKTTAQSASTKADTATSTANTAKATADNASSTASTALTTAQEAKTTALSANAKADTAIQTINAIPDFSIYAKTTTSEGTVVRTSDGKIDLSSKADGVRLTSDNKLQLTSKGTDLGDALELPTGILNLSYKSNTEYTTSEAARKTVKTSDRILGQVITYKLNDGTWVLDQFVGESTGSWESVGSWLSYALQKDLLPVIEELNNIKIQVAGLDASVASKIDGGFTEDMGEPDSLDLILTSNGEEVSRIQIPKGGGGGTAALGVVMKLKANGATSIIVGENTEAVLKYNWTSIDQETSNDTGSGTIYVTANGIPVYTGEVEQGDNEFSIKEGLNLGSNTIRIRITDSYQNVRNLMFKVQKATLNITSTFADDLIYKTKPVAFRYTPVGTGTKKVHFFLNDVEIDTETVTSSGKQLTKELTNISSGVNSIRVYAESTIEGALLTSNELYYEFIYVDASVTQPLISISQKNRVVNQFEIIELPYVVYDPAGETSSVTLIANGEVKQQLTVPRTRQVWGYPAYEQGQLTLEIQVKNVKRTVVFDVVASSYTIAEEKGDLRYKASSIGKSNYSSDKASWKYGNYDAVFKNFLWGEDGWQRDKQGNNHLRLVGDAALEIGIKPFSNTILQNGMTLTLEFATDNVTDTEAEIISCMFNEIGIKVKPNEVIIKSSQTILSAKLDSSTKVSVSFVVQKQADQRLIMLYVDGIMSGSLRYPANDNFTHSTSTALTASSGGRTCTTMLYSVRWYENNLNYDQIFGNYVYDIEDFDQKLTKFKSNDVVNDYGDIDYTKSLEKIPCMTIVGTLPTFKGDKKTNDIIFEDRQNPLNSFTAMGCTNDVQGTSSQFYPRKNFKFKFNSNGITLTETGSILTKYQMQGKQIPANVFCMKADFAESSGTHNTGIAILADEALRELGYKVKPQATDDRVRTTIYGFPILIFHKETATSEPVFLGKYNFNDDKSSTQVFGFTAGCECWEFLNNTSDRCLFRSANFTGTDWLNDFEGRYPDGSTDSTNLAKLLTWIVACKGNPTKFKNECAQHFNVNWLLFYYLLTEVYGMVDQRAKNQMLTTYGEKGSAGELLWYFICYDNDTALGINNEGQISFDYNIESQDAHGSGHVWNGWNSELWTLVESAYKDELKQLYATMRQKGALSADRTLSILQDHQADRWNEQIYNHDGYYKYIAPLIEEGNGSFLYALQGSRSRNRMWWVKNRFMYMDSKYSAGDYLSDYATMRLYTPASWAGVAPNANFNIGISKSGYLHVKYGSVSTTPVRGYAGQTYAITAPAIQFNDTETIIYGISAVKSLGDLSGKYAGTVDISKALALEELIIGSTATGYKNENLTTLHTGTNEMLKKVNVANCPNLKQSLELNKCYSLEEVEARGSGITGLILPDSGVIKTLNLPASLTALYLKNQVNLTTFSIEGYANLNTLVIENVPAVDGYALARQCILTEGSKLGKVRLININVKDDSSKALNSLLNMNGIDDNGNTTNTAVVTGKIHIKNTSQAVIDGVRERMPNLTLTYDNVLTYIEFEDAKMKAIAVSKYDTNTDKEISENEISAVAIPSGLLTGSGVVKFNEARYFGKTGSVIDSCDTLQEVTIVPGKATLKDLPTLKKLGIYSTEAVTDTPLFSYSTVGNCYSVSNFLLTGRYQENSKKGAILARQVDTTSYYRMVLPLRGYSKLEIDEKVAIEHATLPEATYPWGSQITDMVLSNCYKINLPAFSNLRNLTIKGLSDDISNSIIIPTTAPTLDNLIIDDDNNGTLNQLGFYTTVRNIKLLNVRAGGASSALILAHNLASILELDLPATYQPTQMTINSGNGDTNSAGPFAANSVLIIRSPNFIPLIMSNGGINTIPSSIKNIYVPDTLVATYKAASNWIKFSTKIVGLSTL